MCTQHFTYYFNSLLRNLSMKNNRIKMYVNYDPRIIMANV